MKFAILLTKRSKANFAAFGSGPFFEDEKFEKAADVMLPKSVVPVRDFQPEDLFRISSALVMCRSEVELGDRLPVLEA